MKKTYLFVVLTISLSFGLISRQAIYEIVCKDGACQSAISNIINTTDQGMSCPVNNKGIIETCFKKNLAPFWDAKYQGNNKGYDIYNITLNL